jgi:hypothetical protein
MIEYPPSPNLSIRAKQYAQLLLKGEGSSGIIQKAFLAMRIGSVPSYIMDNLHVIGCACIV